MFVIPLCLRCVLQLVLQRSWKIFEGLSVGCSSREKKFHLVNLETVTTLECWGGLETKDLKVFNKALLESGYEDSG